MATKRLTEATLRRIVREETRKLTEAPMMGRPGAGAGEWRTVDNPPYVIADTESAALDEAWSNWTAATDRLSNFADMKLVDPEAGGRPVAVKDMAKQLVRFMLYES